MSCCASFHWPLSRPPSKIQRLNDYGIKIGRSSWFIISILGKPLSRATYTVAIILEKTAPTFVSTSSAPASTFLTRRNGERHRRQGLLHPHEQQDGAREESFRIFAVLFGRFHCLQIFGLVHVFPHLHWFSHQLPDTVGHGSEQEAPTATQLHPGELGRGWTHHGLLWIHSHNLLLHGGIFCFGTYELHHWRIHGYPWRWTWIIPCL